MDAKEATDAANPVLGHDLEVDLDAWLEREEALEALAAEMREHDDWGVEAKLHYLQMAQAQHAELIREAAESYDLDALDEEHRQILERVRAIA